jgi:hypothetical protein
MTRKIQNRDSKRLPLTHLLIGCQKSMPSYSLLPDSASNDRYLGRKYNYLEVWTNINIASRSKN